MATRKADIGCDSTPQHGEAQLPHIWDVLGDGALSQRLLLLAKMIERATARQLQSEFDFSVAQWRVLAFVCLSGPATASFIGEAAEADQAEISRAVRALLQKGLVNRDFAQGSRKAMVISPTPAGRNKFEEIRARRQRYFSRITRSLDDQQRAQLDRFLNLMARDVVQARRETGAD